MEYEEYFRKEKPQKITEDGQECRHCGNPVERKTHTKPPKYKQGSYYFEWWFRCTGCGALYMVEAAKRWFDPGEPIVKSSNSNAPNSKTFLEEVLAQTGLPPWDV